MNKFYVSFMCSAAAVLLSGCANQLYFGTSTAVAVDFSATGATIGYKSVQIAHVPQKEDGSAHPVLGRSDVDLSLTKLIVDEEFATGVAAECAAAKSGTAAATKALNDAAEYGTVIFGSYNSASLIDINFGAANPFAGATFGYKRATATLIPVKDQKLLSSVYAKNTIDTRDHDVSASPNGTKTSGIRFRQLFATGTAAVLLAANNVSSMTEGKKTTSCQ